MNATENLENDHVYILRLTDIMEHITENNSPDIQHLDNIVAIIKNFADGIHHAKEEKFFFPALAKKGFPPTQGPVAVMLNEHEAGRNIVKGISGNLALYKNGHKEALKDMYFNMIEYAKLLRAHISKENNILFKMADNALTQSEQEALLENFKNEEKASSGYINLINDMSSIYAF
jgi:hemerythrin-like domain-containing protein